MKAVIGETDSGKIFWKEEPHVSIDGEKGLLFIYHDEEHSHLKEIINMNSYNFHSVRDYKPKTYTNK